MSDGDDSDKKSGFVEDNNDSESDEGESDAKSATSENDNDADFSSVKSKDKITQQTDESLDTEDASDVESDDESKEKSEDNSDDGQYADDPDKEEYGDIVETDPNPDFDVMLDLILHKK